MTEPTDDRIVDQARQALIAAVEHLDSNTRRRLTQARYAALDALPGTRGFRWDYAFGGVAATIMVAVLAGILWWTQAPPAAFPEQNLADLELLANPDGPEFYAELEFYQWLAAGHAG